MILRSIAAVLALLVLGAPGAFAAQPNHRPHQPVISEPAADGQLVHPADVHMETAPFADTDGDAHLCTSWRIVLAASRRRVWQDNCDQINKVHVHLGDGAFVRRYAGRDQLKYGTDYILRVRHRQVGGGRLRWSPWEERRFSTSPQPPTGTDVVWTVRQPGFRVDVVATGLQLPVNIAFLPNPPATSADPLFYVAELFGAIKAVASDGTMTDYFNGALNYAPPLSFPGAGEQGLTGIVVEPVTGDVFASLLYEAADGLKYPKIVRFHSNHGGAVADSVSLVIEMPNDPMSPSHQISNLTIGPDGKLYAHVGDGFVTATAQDLDFFRGKIVRMNLDGSAPTDNPFYNATDGISARDYVFAYGFRNPFGGAWRSADQQHYEVENGPAVDRFAKVVRGRNYLWDGTNMSIRNHALYVWSPSVAPVNLAFIEAGTFGGSGFPADKFGHAFVTESGPTYAAGPQIKGKRVSEFVLDADGSRISGPTPLVDYTGTGRATAVGLAAGPDGLYFTDLYEDQGAGGPTGPGARVLRITWVGP